MTRIWSCGVLILLLASCASTSTSRQNDYVVSRDTVAKITLQDIEQIKPANSTRATLPDEDVLRIFNWLASGDYERASKWLNAALNYQIDSSSLQFLNGLTYHLMSTHNISKRPLAREGYMLAIRFDRNNWIAHRFLGILEMENRNYAQALHHLSQAALLNTEPDLLEYMGSAAYLAHQPNIAAGVFNQLLELDPNNQQYQSTYALTLAAMGLNQQALAVANTMTDASRNQYTLNRIDNWRTYHQRHPAPLIDSESSSNTLVTNDDYLLAQAFALSESEEDEFYKNYTQQDDISKNSGDDATDNGNSTNQMVVLDVVIIRSEEEAISSRGVNLLNGLNILFGYSKDNPSSDLQISSLHLATDKKVLGGGITGGALQYSLNIMNMASNHSEILAQPSLVVMDGETSRFFSGANIHAAAISSGGEDNGGASIVIEKDIGVSLGVTPTFLESGQIKLEIQAMHTFITKPDQAITFDLRIDTLKTEINGYVVMNIGDTLILSGLNERETRVDRSGVPFLQDIPVVQYLFSKRTSADFQRSVLILVTPRVPAYSNKKSTENGINGITELQSRYIDWFVPYPNWASAFHHLKGSQLYNEFRTGDVTVKVWKNKKTLKARLLDAVKFLYF